MRLTNDVERQPARFVPDRDRLDERAGGEFAAADRAWSGAFDAGADRIGDAGAELLRAFSLDVLVGRVDRLYRSLLSL